MWFGILTLVTAIAIAGVAAWFSIVGLMLLFSGMPLSIAVMAGTLEVGKLLTASWLYRYWNETSIMLRTYLTTAVVVLMLVTSIGIFGYLSKAASDQAGDIGDAVAVVERIDAQIDREENKIALIEDRILGIGGSVDISASIEAQEDIRDGAWARVQGDIDYNQEQIENVREQLTVDIAQQDSRLAELDKAVNELRAKGVEVVTLDEGGAFRSAETEKIDYIAQANELRASQQAERDEIKEEKQSLRDQATADINVFQTAIDNYRQQAQDDINGANAEINRLRNQSSTQADDNLLKINQFNADIDAIYANIVTLKDEKFDAESKIRNLDREVGPIKYLAQLIYGSEEREVLDEAIRLFILMLVFVFDPLAVMLIIAANQTLLRYGINLESSGPPVPPKDSEPEPKEPTIEDMPGVEVNHSNDHGSIKEDDVLSIVDPDNPDSETITVTVDEMDLALDPIEFIDDDNYESPFDTLPDVEDLEIWKETEETFEEAVQPLPAAVDDAAEVMAESAAPKKHEQPVVYQEIETRDGLRKPVDKEDLSNEIKSILGPKTKKQLLEFASYYGVADATPDLTKAQLIDSLLASGNTTVENFRTFFKAGPSNIWEKQKEKENDKRDDGWTWEVKEAKPDEDDVQDSKFSIKK